MSHMTHDMEVIVMIEKLDGLGPIDTRPSTNCPKNLTHDMGHVTCDKWEEVNLLSKFQLPSSYGLGIWFFEDIFTTHLINLLMCPI